MIQVKILAKCTSKVCICLKNIGISKYMYRAGYTEHVNMTTEITLKAIIKFAGKR